MLGISEHGIVDARDRERIRIIRLHANGSYPDHIAVDPQVTDCARLETGDIAVGTIAPVSRSERKSQADAAFELTGVSSINGVDPDSAASRPTPRETRNIYERIRPHRRVSIAVSSQDVTGRAIDLAAPVGVGCAGIIHGPHGGGLTTALFHVVSGFRVNAPDVIPIVLLLRSRSEEVTHWRRAFPESDVVVCPSAQSGAPPEETLDAADLVMEAAQRQTEMGRHVLLAVDSLTGLWGAMLEAEEADAQREADIAASRHRIRQWIQKAGDFTGEGFLGSRIGGSLTLIGTAWSTRIDVEAEEEGETHPHLRLLEHLIPESNWLLALSGELADDRLYPAVDIPKCQSRYEESILDSSTFMRIQSVRRNLQDLPLVKQHDRLISAIEAVDSEEALIDMLGEGARPPSPTAESIRNLLGGAA